MKRPLFRSVWLLGLRAPASVRYSFGASVAVVASLIRIALNPVWGQSFPYIFYFPATLLTALFGGAGPASVGIAICAVMTAVWIVPGGSLSAANRIDLMGLSTFVFIDGMIAWIGAAYRALVLEDERQTAALLEREEALRRALDSLGNEERAAQAARSEAEGRLRDVQSLVDINRELARTLDLTELLPKLCRVVREAVGADGATFVLRDGDRVRYVAEDAIAPLWAGKSFAIERCISGWSILRQETAVVEDVYVDERVPLEAYKPTFVRSLVMVPMRREREFVGAMGAYWSSARRASEREVALLEAVVGAASAAVANAQLFGEMRSARSDAEKGAEMARRVQRIADAVLADLALEDLLHEVLVRVQQTLETDVAVMLVSELEEEVLRVRAVVGTAQAEIGFVVPSGQGFCGLVAKRRRAVVWNDVDPEQVIHPFLRRMGVRALAGVPLLSGHRLLGVLQVASVRPRTFEDDEVNLLQLAGERIAFGIERTARRDAERRVRDSLEASNRAKDEFLAMLGHELRNPLSAVRNAVATASLDDSRRPHALEIAQRQVDQLGRLIDDLLDVALITQGRLTLRRKRVHLTEIIERAVESTRAFIESRGIRFAVGLASDSIWVEADPARLEQVFVNLLSNAAKYTDAGGRIDVTSERQGEDVAVRVRDTGIGIAPEMLPRIWDPFTRGDVGVDRAQGGLGLGLTIARRLVDLHDGRIEAHSQGFGRGAEFVVTLPVSPAATEEAGQTAPAGLPQPRSARVLLVEDNPDTAESLSMLLEVLGHSVRSVYDGVTALDAARADRPEVMIVDIGLPGMDGYEVAQRVRRDPDLKHLTLVALTGYGREEDKQRAMAAGFDHHLVKPVTPDALDALVARLGKEEPEIPITVH